VNRRTFLVGSGGAVLSAVRGLHAQPPARPQATWLTLVPRQAPQKAVVINVGVPFPPGAVSDPRRIHISTERGVDIPAVIRVLEPWRVRPDDATGAVESIRSAQIQFRFDVADQRGSRPIGRCRPPR
jgi:hypothetical protein